MLLHIPFEMSINEMSINGDSGIIQQTMSENKEKKEKKFSFTLIFRI